MSMSSIIDELRSRHFTALSLNQTPIEELIALLKRHGYRTTTTLLEVKDSERSRPLSLSKKYGTGSFPFHTDFAFRATPPRFIVLCNLSNSAFMRGTRICAFSTLDESLRKNLKRSTWRLQTARGGCVLSAEIVLGSHRGFRWDTDFLTPENDPAHAALKALPIAMSSSSTEIKWEPNSALLIDNWSCVHARSNTNNETIDYDRTLTRIEAWGDGRMVA